MKNITNVISALLLAFLLSSCGSSSVSENEDGIPQDNSEPTSKPEQMLNTVVGTAIAGVIKNGIVKIYGLDNDAQSTFVLADGKTDADGKYSLTVNDYMGPLVVEITADSSTSMVCDLIDGCGDALFGQDVPLTDSFVMKAAASALDAKQVLTVNVSSLTHLAASLAGSEDLFNADLVRDANSQVSALFNITADLTALDNFAITDFDAMERSGLQAKEAAILNSALLSAAFKDAQEEASIGEVMSALAAEFTLNKGQFFFNGAEDSLSVSMVEIYEEASVILNDPKFSELDMGTFKSAVALKLNQAKSAETDAKTNAIPSKPEDRVAAQAARDMVQAIRYFALSATYEDSNEASLLNKVNAIIDGFGGSNEGYPPEVDSRGLDNILRVLAVVGKMIADADEANRDGEISDFSYSSELISTPVEILIAAHDDEYIYNVNNRICLVFSQDSCVDVSFEAKLSAEGYFEGVDDSYNPNIGLNVSGILQTDDFEMQVTTGEITLDLIGDSEEESLISGEGENHTTRIEENSFVNLEFFSAKLDISLRQKIREEVELTPPSFQGILDFSVRGFQNISSSNDVCDFMGCELESEVQILSLGEISLILRGQFYPDLGEEYIQGALYIAFEADNSIHRQVASITSYDCGIDIGLCLDLGNELLGETEEDFIDFQFAVELYLNLETNPDITGISLAVNRTEIDAAQIVVDVAVGLNRLNINIYESDNIHMIVTDQHGNTLSLTENCNGDSENCAVSGSIEVDNQQVASVTQDDNAIIIIYQDGSFEIL